MSERANEGGLSTTDRDAFGIVVARRDLDRATGCFENVVGVGAYEEAVLALGQ
jgi:hypothetical protein